MEKYGVADRKGLIRRELEQVEAQLGAFIVGDRNDPLVKQAVARQDALRRRATELRAELAAPADE